MGLAEIAGQGPALRAFAERAHEPVAILFEGLDDLLAQIGRIDRFAALTETHTTLSFVPILSEDSGPDFQPGYVTDAVATDLRDLDGWKAYLAGPPVMVDAAGPMLLERGLRADDIHADVFFTPEYGAS